MTNESGVSTIYCFVIGQTAKIHEQEACSIKQYKANKYQIYNIVYIFAYITAIAADSV